MDSRAVKVFIACFLGAGIGVLVSLELIKPHYPYLWWIGVLIGGLTGYLSYEFKEVCQAIPRAWNQVVEWKPDKEWWKGWVIFEVALMVIILDLGLLVLFILALANQFAPLVDKEYDLIFVWVSTGVGVFLFLLFSISCSLLEYISPIMAKEHKRESFKKVIKYGNPISIPFVAIVYIFKAIHYVVKRTPTFLVYALSKVVSTVKIIGAFIKIIFILIHSDERLLCGVDAAIGATVGYFCGSALYGAMFGGIFGVINFELVSRWWLGLCKVKAQN